MKTFFMNRLLKIRNKTEFGLQNPKFVHCSFQTDVKIFLNVLVNSFPLGGSSSCSSFSKYTTSPNSVVAALPV